MERPGKSAECVSVTLGMTPGPVFVLRPLQEGQGVGWGCTSCQRSLQCEEEGTSQPPGHPHPEAVGAGEGLRVSGRCGGVMG